MIWHIDEKMFQELEQVYLIPCTESIYIQLQLYVIAQSYILIVNIDCI